MITDYNAPKKLKLLPRTASNRIALGGTVQAIAAIGTQDVLISTIAAIATIDAYASRESRISGADKV